MCSSCPQTTLGSPGHDQIDGGSANNTFSGGPGGRDYLVDWGGCSPTLEAGCKSALLASNATYLGFSGGPDGGVDPMSTTSAERMAGWT